MPSSSVDSGLESQAETIGQRIQNVELEEKTQEKEGSEETVESASEVSEKRKRRGGVAVGKRRLKAFAGQEETKGPFEVEEKEGI